MSTATTSFTSKRLPFNLTTLNYITAIVMVLFHVGAVAALFYFSWTNFFVALALHWMAVGFGISLGYHRLHTHRGYKTSKAFEYFLAVCGTLTLEGGPIFWVATHRIHHKFVETEKDPHSTRPGFYWAHLGWILRGTANDHDEATLKKYVPDLMKDKFHTTLAKYYYVVLIASGFILFAIGGWSMVLWGVFARVVFGWHSTWLVNSATHYWGNRRFETKDDSTNNVWIALLTFGEGWHNNHHAQPASARHGLKWYEFDMNWLTIQLFEKLGWAKQIREFNTEKVSVELKQAA